MKKRIVFFNPETFNKRVITFIFQWDYLNSCWDVQQFNCFGNVTIKYAHRPEMLVQQCIDIYKKDGEYVTIKNYSL